MREFNTGATRNLEDGKPDYEGFLSPDVLIRYGEYMHEHRKQADGQLRDSDNWQKGIPKDVYIKSMFRHFMTVWKHHRRGGDNVQEELCALMFNVMGYLHEDLRGREQFLAAGVSELNSDTYRRLLLGDTIYVGDEWFNGAVWVPVTQRTSNVPLQVDGTTQYRRRKGSATPAYNDCKLCGFGYPGGVERCPVCNARRDGCDVRITT